MKEIYHGREWTMMGAGVMVAFQAPMIIGISF